METSSTSPSGLVGEMQFQRSEATTKVREWLSKCRDTPATSLSTESVSKEDDLQDSSYSPESTNGPGGGATKKNTVLLID